MSDKSNQLSDKSKPSFDVLKHVYVPKHEILPKKEADEVLIKYNAKHGQLPFIFLSDPALRELSAKPGDIIKITRKSPTAGESIYYRYVVEG
ncbi:MAG: DNA-directed RNA polymerase subunit H [Candidatus Nitrosomirales archaeon]|jgi:DNA-directed RNA polymerase subunit H